MPDIIAEFTFSNSLAIGANETITNQHVNDIGIRIWRMMRVTPLPGMKQPLLNRAIMGMETVLEMLVAAGPAKQHRWILKCNNKIIQRGTTNDNGISGEINIDLSDDGIYVLSVLGPRLTKSRKLAKVSG